MRSGRALALALLGLLAVSAPATEVREDKKVFYERMKAARKEFEAAQRGERRAFEAGLSGKTGDERRALRAAFDEAEKGRRRDFEALQKKRFRQYYESRRAREHPGEEKP